MNSSTVSGGDSAITPKHRRTFTTAVLLLDLAAITASLIGLGGTSRTLLGLSFALLVPGWAGVGLLRLEWPAAEVALTVAVSLALIMAAAQIMLWSHTWHPIVGQLVLGAAAVPLLLLQLRSAPDSRLSRS